MCSICGQTPCNPRCPNAKEPEPVAYCQRCFEPLYKGDEVLDGDMLICKECLKNMDIYDWLELLGEELTEVEDDYV